MLEYYVFTINFVKIIPKYLQEKKILTYDLRKLLLHVIIIIKYYKFSPSRQ